MRVPLDILPASWPANLMYIHLDTRSWHFGTETNKVIVIKPLKIVYIILC